MFRSHGPSEYRCLAEFLEIGSRRDYVARFAITRFEGLSMAMWALLGAAIIAPWSEGLPLDLKLLLALVPAYGFLRPLVRSILRRTRASMAFRMHDRSVDLCKSMLRLLQRRRLHRVLGEETIEILDECAAQWLRAKHALSYARWQGEGVPTVYERARTTGLTTLDGVMNELVLFFEVTVKTTPPNGDILDTVADFLRPLTRAPQKAQSLHPAYQSCRDLCHRLSSMADEIESINRSMPARFIGSTLVEESAATRIDATIGEFRSLHQAEQELRQDTGQQQL